MTGLVAMEVPVATVIPVETAFGVAFLSRPVNGSRLLSAFWSSDAWERSPSRFPPAVELGGAASGSYGAGEAPWERGGGGELVVKAPWGFGCRLAFLLMSRPPSASRHQRRRRPDRTRPYRGAIGRRDRGRVATWPSAAIVLLSWPGLLSRQVGCHGALPRRDLGLLTVALTVAMVASLRSVTEVSQAVPCVSALADSPSGGFSEGVSCVPMPAGLPHAPVSEEVAPGGGRAQVSDLEHKGKTALFRYGPSSSSHCLTLNWFRSHVGSLTLPKEVVGRSQRLASERGGLCVPLLAACGGGLVGGSAYGPSTWWRSEVAVPVVRRCFSHGCSVSLVVTPGWSFPTSWVRDVGACVVRLWSHVVAPVFLVFGLTRVEVEAFILRRWALCSAQSTSLLELSRCFVCRVALLVERLRYAAVVLAVAFWWVSQNDALVVLVEPCWWDIVCPHGQEVCFISRALCALPDGSLVAPLVRVGNVPCVQCEAALGVLLFGLLVQASSWCVFSFVPQLCLEALVAVWCVALSACVPVWPVLPFVACDFLWVAFGRVAALSCLGRHVVFDLCSVSFSVQVSDVFLFLVGLVRAAPVELSTSVCVLCTGWGALWMTGLVATEVPVATVIPVATSFGVAFLSRPVNGSRLLSAFWSSDACQSGRNGRLTCQIVAAAREGTFWLRSGRPSPSRLPPTVVLGGAAGSSCRAGAAPWERGGGGELVVKAPWGFACGGLWDVASRQSAFLLMSRPPSASRHQRRRRPGRMRPYRGAIGRRDLAFRRDRLDVAAWSAVATMAVPCVSALADGPSGGFRKGCHAYLCLLGLSWLQANCAISVVVATPVLFRPGGSACGPSTWWRSEVVVPVVRRCFSHGCSVSLVVTPGCSFLTSWVWDVGACVVRLWSHVVAPVFRVVFDLTRVEVEAFLFAATLAGRDSLSQEFVAGRSWWWLVLRALPAV
ncbi:hypothetical protein Taro_010814 [Colocasia esculenta]|uniref:Uncharacterized protein n=1 Tax=Colocasia esculenta TaxID=4460 RepID=A0A843U9A1_COLES|nr:hypothetical protein [Colocasia esculenta]